MQHTKVILESANRYNKAVENNNPVEQAKAMGEFRESLCRFVLEVMKEQRKNKREQAKEPFR